MNNKKIMITGATGFIGSHLTELLVKEGFDVVAFDRYNSDNNWGWLEETEVTKDIKVVLPISVSPITTILYTGVCIAILL